MRFVAMTDVSGAQLEVVFGGQHEQRATEYVDVDEFIAVKSHRAKGKRITNYEVATLKFIEPEIPDEELGDDDEAIGEDMDEMPIDGVDTTVDDGAADAETSDETINVGDMLDMGIKADPKVDYRKRDEKDDAGFTVSQLDLF